MGMNADHAGAYLRAIFHDQGARQGNGPGALHGVRHREAKRAVRLGLETEPGRGTTFKVFLPRVDAPVPAPARDSPRAPRRGGDETVLVVEDQEPVRRLTRKVLETHGYAVLAAADGPEALQLAERHPGAIHILVTDVVMPGMSGREVGRRLAAQRPDMRVLYLSGYADDSIVRHGVLEPGLAFLQKPFTPEILTRRVRELLDSPRDPRP